MSDSLSILAILREQAELLGSKIAIESSFGQRLSYADLYGVVANNVEEFARKSVVRGEPIAVVLPGGLNQAVSMLSAASYGACVPFDPKVKAAEYVEICDRLEIRSVVTVDLERNRQFLRDQSRAFFHDVSRELPVGELPEARIADSGDPAFLLGSSGTTSEKKFVEYRQSEIISFAYDVVDVLQLTGADSCVNIMPFHHAHGLIISLLATLFSGGCVYCMEPFFIPQKFLGILQDKRPTWYTASPAHHAAIVEAHQRSQTADLKPLRFVKSGASILDVALELSLRETFHAPVIQSYALSEVLGVLSASPFPPEENKPGSVGKVRQSDMRLIGPTGRDVPQGEIGQVAVPMGRKIVYHHERARIHSSGELFETGDLGFVDEDGFLFLVGRQKEIINRGGEKVSPFEIESVLGPLPGISEVVAFPISSKAYGEEICVAIVPEVGEAPAVEKIRREISEKLSPGNVPDKYLFVDKIPKNEIGKYERLKLENLLLS